MKNSRLAWIEPRAHLVDRRAIGELDRRRDRFVERLRAVVAQRHQRRFGQARHQRRHDSRHRDHALQAVLLGRLQNLAQLQRAIAVEIGRGQLRHRADAGDRVDLAVFRADQDGRFPAPADVRIFGGRGGEDAGDAGIHRVAARVVHAHGGFGGIAAAGGDRAVRAARRILRRTLRRLAAARTQRRTGITREPRK